MYKITSRILATAHDDVSNVFRSSTFLIGRFGRPIINLETFISKEHGSYSKTGTIYRFNLFEAVAKSKKKNNLDSFPDSSECDF